MQMCRALTGVYPYSYWVVTCPSAFEMYLKAEGLKPEMFEDVRRIVTLAIRRGDAYPWDTFRAVITAGGRTWHDWPERELYIRDVAPKGGVRVLCEAAQLGFVDHRLEHAIITIQRLVRYRRASPQGSLAEFERIHHQPEPSWRVHGIHLKSFSETGVHFSDEDIQDEASFVAWNRQCIPEYISELARGTVDVDADYEFSEGIPLVVEEDVWGAVIKAIKDKREALYRKKMEFLLDDDALAKTGMLIRLHAENRLRKKRDARRDALKFISFALNEPAPATLARGSVRGVPVAKCYLERLDALPLHVVEDVFRALPFCLASYGRDLIHRFSKVKIDSLPLEEVRRWYLDIILDDAADVCAGTGVEVRALKAFLGKDLGEKFAEAAPEGSVQIRAQVRRAADLARSHLSAVQQRVLAGKPIYDYSVWVEPVKVTPVTLVSDREAALGRDRGRGRDRDRDDRK